MLVSLNVGLPRNVTWHDRTVYTGVFKTPVQGPRMVRRLNIDGDGQGDLGGHGGEQRAVLVYQTDSYRYWEKQLGRDHLEPGQFGENFTVDGLPDDEVCIGDRYQIGEAVLEVTQPRVTCYRVGLRMGEPRMAALLVSHRRPGFYCRVIREGEVAAGQAITKLSSGPEHVTVAEIDALLYLPGHPRDVLSRALRVQALSPGWKGSLRSLEEQAKTGGTGNAGLSAAATSPPPAWPGFRPLTVTTIQPESSTVFSLTLADVDGAPLPPWRPGQSITVKVTPPGASPLIRNYSLSNNPGSDQYRVGIKQEPHGAASNYLSEMVGIGDRIDVAAPRGTFFLSDGVTPVVLLSAGIGVTPVLSMLHALAAAGSRRPVWWLHGARDGAEHPFAAETRQLLDQLDSTHTSIFYSRPTAHDQQGADYTATGRMSAELIGALGLPRDADAYLCGPTTFMSELGTVLTGAGLDPVRIHHEAFGAEGALTPGIATAAAVPPHPPPDPPGTGPPVAFARSGITAPWDSRYASLLEFAEACDVPTRWSCRTGVCHTCETALLAGAVRDDPDPVEPAAPGNTLICCAQPSGGDLVLDL